MADKLLVRKVNEAFVRVDCEPSVAAELSVYFTFEVPGAKFTPQYRARIWDGKIRLFDRRTCQIYYGLIDYINAFAKEREYEVEYDSEVITTTSFSIQEATEFAKSLNIHSRGKPVEVRDYQIMAFAKAIRNKRQLLLSPTASGKSLIAYLICRYMSGRGLIIVPTTSLVEQLYKDFEDYSSENGWNVEENVNKIYYGQDKSLNKRIVISTWQSLYKLPKEWFADFDFVIGDEAHNFKAKSLISIMTKLDNCGVRIGMTGTIDGTKTHKLVLEGVFGPVKKVISTAELIEKKQLADFKIKVLVLKYPDEICKKVKELSYQEEMDYIVSCEARNTFIKNLTLSLHGNTLVLFQYVDKHGKKLFDMISEKCDNRHCFFVYGGTDVEDREKVREIMENENDAIAVASYGTFSTGINIRNLHNIIFASPTKSKIRNLQSIGRGLRISDKKDQAILFDLVDDMRHKSRDNYTLLHFVERVKIYDEEKFEYKMYKIELKV